MPKHTISDNIPQIVEQNVEQKKQRNSIKFTHHTLYSLKELKRKKQVFWCAGMVGFGIEISKKGTKTWIYQYRFNKKARRMVLGKFPKISLAQATTMYSQLCDKVAHGIDPLLERERKKRNEKDELTLDDLIHKYFNHCQKTGKKSLYNEKRGLESNLTPQILKKRITEVDSKDIAKIVTKIINRDAPIMAQHFFKYIRRVFNYGADIGLMRRRDNPCLDIKVSVPKKKRQRHLSPVEIYLFWINVDKTHISLVMRLLLKFLLVTVARPIEVREMKWTDIDLVNGVWTLPISKNGRLHRVYLGKIALEILHEVKQYTGGYNVVFGFGKDLYVEQDCKDFTTQLVPMKKCSISRALRRNFELLEIKEKFYPYDLRRTGATLIAGLFGRRDLASLALNHTTSSVTDIYDQYAYDREKKMSLDALNKAIEIIIKSPNVESVPSFDQLRDQVFSKASELIVDTKQDFQASFSSPVSYTLSYTHDD